MNQVTEMLRLAPGATAEDAVARLSGLFEMMRHEPGFRAAEVLRRLDEPDVLLVLHAWNRLADWQAFQTSQRKTDFSASRPASLYSFLPCGMNWRLEAGALEEGEGGFLHREVTRGSVAPRSGADVVASATFSYADTEPAYAGATLRLTRLFSAPSGDRPTERASDGETYRSLNRIRRLEISAQTVSTAGRRPG
jgi:heme-degrading monooxygenase HmoA